MTGSRIIRGFRRLGIVVALPCLIASAIILVVGLYEYATAVDPDAWWKNAPLAKSESGAISFDDLIPKKESAERGPWLDYQKKEPRLVPVDHNPFASQQLKSSAGLAALIASIGAALFAACWALGWTIAGFAKD